jgi:hypothetical protein
VLVAGLTLKSMSTMPSRPLTRSPGKFRLAADLNAQDPPVQEEPDSVFLQPEMLEGQFVQPAP